MEIYDEVQNEYKVHLGLMYLIIIMTSETENTLEGVSVFAESGFARLKDSPGPRFDYYWLQIANICIA